MVMKFLMAQPENSEKAVETVAFESVFDQTSLR